MTGRTRIEKYGKIGLPLTQVERKLVVEGVAGLPQGIAQTIQTTPAKQPIRMTLDDWKELAGQIASEANETGDSKLQERHKMTLLAHGDRTVMPGLYRRNGSS